MFSSTIDTNHKGWEIKLLKFSGICAEKVRGLNRLFPAVENFTARNLKSGVSINSSTFEGLRSMIDAKNSEIRKGPSWRN
jgi:hypothetical protein